MLRRMGPVAPVASVCGLYLATLMMLGIAHPASAQLPPPPPEVLSPAYPGKAYSPYAGRGFPSRVFWGDTHLHTGLSADAGAFGNTLGLDEAYRYARGEEITIATGLQARLSRPLDFLVVADHSDGMGMFLDLLASKPDILVDPTGTVEGLNNKAKLIIHRAHGFRTAANYIRNLYHCMADLPLPRTVHTFV